MDGRITFDELRSTPTQVAVTARAGDFGRVVSVFTFEGRRIMAVRDYPSMEAAESALVPAEIKDPTASVVPPACHKQRLRTASPAVNHGHRHSVHELRRP